MTEPVVPEEAADFGELSRVGTAATTGTQSPRYRWLGPLLAVYWLFIFTATHAPQAALPQTHLGDKTEHFIAYGILAAIMCAWLRFTRPTWRRIALPVLLICAAYAAVDELTQPIVNRYADIRDFLADTIGAAIGVLIAMIVFRRG